MSARRLFILASAVALATPVHADEKWPSRPIRIVVASAPGSGGDSLARLIADRLSQALKQPVIVDNKVGANGRLAAGEVARAKPDGYTLLFGSAAGTIVNQAMQPAVAIDVLDAFTPVVQVGSGGINLVVSPDLPVRNVNEFIAYAKAQRPPLSYATWGVGTTGHLAMEWLKHRNDIELQHVPYRSMVQITQELLGGVVKVAFIDVATSMPFVNAGKIRALGTTGSARAPGLPDVPTFKEQGIDFAVDGWYGLFAPKGSPDAVVNALHGQVVKVVSEPALQQQMALLNVSNPPIKTPGEFRRTIAADLKLWTSIVKTNNITVE